MVGGGEEAMIGWIGGGLMVKRENNYDKCKNDSLTDLGPRVSYDKDHPTMVHYSQESGRKYWATRSSVRSFSCTALHASFARFAAFILLLAPLTHSGACE